jgi:hypothetical protein
MGTSKRQIKTDVTIQNISEATAVRIFQSLEAELPNEVENALSPGEAVCDGGRIHMDDQGSMTSEHSVPSKRRNSGSLRKHVVARIDKKWQSG